MKMNNFNINITQAILFLLTNLIFNSALRCQNLVDNPSFENITFYKKEVEFGGKANDRIKKFDSWNIFFAGDYCNCQNKYKVPRHKWICFVKPQLFGTQFKKMVGKENDYELYDYESLEVLNLNRLKYGLPLLTPKSLHQVRTFYYTHIIDK